MNGGTKSQIDLEGVGQEKTLGVSNSISSDLRGSSTNLGKLT